MMLINRAIALIGAVFITSLTVAQDSITKPHVSPPIPVEILLGNNRIAFEFKIGKKINDSRFGLMAMSSFAADYKNEKSENESMNMILINYEILKGLGITSGAALNSNWGFRPYSGLQYRYAYHNFSAMTLPGFYLTESHNFEVVGLLEYAHKLTNKYSMYYRLKGLLNVDMNTKKHDRSCIYARLGIVYKKYCIGVGVNYDWYGPLKIYKENFGLFTSIDLK